MPDSDESDRLITEDAVIFAWIFMLFIMSWVSVAVVGRAIDNFTFSTLKLNDKSTFHTCVIAFVIIGIEFATIYYFNSIGIKVYDTSGWGLPDDTSGESNTNSNNVSPTKIVAKDGVFSPLDHISGIARITII